MAHPNFDPDGNPLSALNHRMSRKTIEIQQAPEMLTLEQLDTVRRNALALAQAAGRALAARRGA